MSFISELERLTQACKDFESHYEYEKRRLFLGKHADEIAELVKEAENLRDVSGRFHTEQATIRLFAALANLNKEKS